MRRLLALLVLLALPLAARAQFPAQPPCGSAFVFEPAVVNGTRQFDQVTVPGLAAPTGPFTVEAWVKYHPAEGTTTWPDGFHTIAAFGEVNRGDRPLLNVRYGQLELWTGSSVVSGGAVPLDAWTHVAYTWDGTTNRLFVGGVETATSTRTPSFGGASFYIGYSRGNTGWSGLLDEVMVWNEARTPAQIAADAQGLRSSYPDVLYAYFKFDTIWYDVWTGEAFASDEVDETVRGALGWTTDYPTGAPVTTPVRTPGPENATVLTCMLRTPLGVAVRPDGVIDITEVGTGRQDGRLLGYLPGGSGEPFAQVFGLASEQSPEGMPAGTNQIGYDAAGRVLVLQGIGTGPNASTLLVVDPSLGTNDQIVERHDVGAFMAAQGFAESNPYAVALGPDDDFFVVDAGANAIVRIEDVTGAMNVFAVFEPVENPAPVGPPLTDAVPTGIAFDGERFFVSAFTGFPFATGAGRLYTVDLAGRVSVHRDDLTTVIDVDLDPRDGMPVVLEFARTGAPGEFRPGTGRIVKFYGYRTDTLATGLTMPTALAHAADGTLYVTTMGGQLLQYEAGSTVDTEQPAEVPTTFALEANYPNPFNPSTLVRYTLSSAQPVRLAAYDLLGRPVALLAAGPQPAGTHTLTWDAAGLASGVYLIRLDTPTGSATQRAVLMK